MYAMLFCDACGAANPDQAQQCFACHQTLTSSTSSSAPAAFISASIGKGAVALQLAEPKLPHVAGMLPTGFLFAERYTIIEQVGKGGFGIVYKAKDTKQHDKLVAVKQINLDHISPRDMIQATDSYNREITLYPPLKHKNLPRAYAHFTDPKHWYLVMDFIQGETLEEYLKRAPGGKLPLREALSMGIQLCRVLCYLHREHGLIFRDVKPANIMRTHRGHLFLIDFGIARRYVSGKAKDTAPLGSPGYAAPEQYSTAQTTMRTDIYGLGATLLTLVTGGDLSEDTSSGAPPDPHQVPPIPQKLQALLDQMLAHDVSKRPKNMEVVRRKLRIIRDGILGVMARDALTILTGMLLGSIPYLFYMGVFSLFHVPTPLTIFGFFVYALSLTAICLEPLGTMAELVIGILFLFSPSKRLLGLGMISIFLLLALLLILGRLPLLSPTLG